VTQLVKHLQILALLTWTAVGVRPSLAAQKGLDALAGFYVLAAGPTEQCSQGGWAYIAAPDGSEWGQMKVEGRTIEYFHGSVTCEVHSATPSKETSWPRLNPYALDVDMTCHDEGTAGRHEQTWHFVRTSSKAYLVVSEAGLIPDVWIKCNE
jgi:hypothetical protein